jgi:hypothetical protein
MNTTSKTKSRTWLYLSVCYTGPRKVPETGPAGPKPPVSVWEEILKSRWRPSEDCPRAPAGGRFPGAHKAVRYALCLRASEFASTAQRFHERRRMTRRAPASASDHQDLLSFVICLGAASCSGRHATRVVAWEPGCSGRLLAIFWHRNPPEITRFPWWWEPACGAGGGLRPRLMCQQLG